MGRLGGIGLALTLLACGAGRDRSESAVATIDDGARPVSPATSPPPVKTDGTCAGDAPWIADLGLPPPVRSTLMRFDRLRQRGGFGPSGPAQTFNEFGGVTRRVEEKYEWPPPRPHMSKLQLVVLRDASGPIPTYYDSEAPVRHAGGAVVEYPQRREPLDGRKSFLFVFDDGTWVRTGGERAERVRERLAMTGTPPPRSTIHEDVALEACGAIDQNELSLPWATWAIRGNRVVARLFASQQRGELVYAFDSAALAAKAAAAQRRTCDTTPCTWVTNTNVEGPLVRFGVTVNKTPTKARYDFHIAHTTPRLAAPPRGPVVVGMPPSGVYQQFAEFLADTCPTRAAGKRFPSMFDVILIEHRDGKAFTTLETVVPRAAGVLTGSRMKNVELTIGAVVRREVTHLCPNYKLVMELTVTEVTANTIVVRDIMRHEGSTKGCRNRHLPSDCGHEAKTTWVLARPACPAECDASYDGPFSGSSTGPAPSIDATCACP